MKENTNSEAGLWSFGAVGFPVKMVINGSLVDFIICFFVLGTQRPLSAVNEEKKLKCIILSDFHLD